MRNLQRFSDHLNREVVIPLPPRRVISLCPSQTETLVAFQLGDRLVGRTKFCIHPQPALESVAKVGGTKQVNFELIHQLNPDLIICEKEENTPEMVEQLAKDFPVFVTDVVDVPSALRMIYDLGRITDSEAEAESIVRDITTGFETLPTLAPPKRTAYLIWRKPWMVAGHSNYIHALLTQLGLQNVFADRSSRYPEVTGQELAEANPEVVLLSSEPFPFKEKHIEELKEFLPRAEIRLVDGEMFSWYGVRMREAVQYLSGLVTLLKE